jgi:Zn-dependent protease/CBS domain-containing protein
LEGHFVKWSLRIARVAGIGIYLHWTFLLLLAWIASIHIANRHEIGAIVHGLGFVIAIFTCVVLHELGHALAARRYGIPTRDITLLPIGGLARLERMPDDPKQELVVAMAGPAVNLVIAAILLAMLVAVGEVDDLASTEIVERSFLSKLMAVNVILVVFNLLPAFPMDGGRVLRAILAMRMPRVQATNIAASVGQMMAFFFGIMGFASGNWILMFIAVFVYLGAQAESHAAEMRMIFSSVVVRDVMTTRFETLLPDDTLEQAAHELLAGHQHDFPVVDGGKVVGMLRRSDLFKAMKSDFPQGHVRDIMSSECPQVEALDSLDQVVSLMQEKRLQSLPVLFQGQLVGLLTSENVGEWTMLNATLRERLIRHDEPL